MARIAAIALAVAAMCQAAPAQEAPVYRLSYIPDEQENLICFAREDALALLTVFHEIYMAEARPRTRRILRGFAGEFGPGKRYDCGFVRSIYVPILPVEAIDLVEEFGTGWEGRQKKAHYFVATNLLVGEMKYTQTASGGRIYVFASEFEILKE